jgi:hypothetical protein
MVLKSAARSTNNEYKSTSERETDNEIEDITNQNHIITLS